VLTAFFVEMLCIMARKKSDINIHNFNRKSYRMPRYIQKYNIQLFEKNFFEIQEQIAKTKKKLQYLVKGIQKQNIMNSHFPVYTNIQIHSSALL